MGKDDEKNKLLKEQKEASKDDHLPRQIGQKRTENKMENEKHAFTRRRSHVRLTRDW